MCVFKCPFPKQMLNQTIKLQRERTLCKWSSEHHWESLLQEGLGSNGRERLGRALLSEAMDAPLSFPGTRDSPEHQWCFLRGQDAPKRNKIHCVLASPKSGFHTAFKISRCNVFPEQLILASLGLCRVSKLKAGSHGRKDIWEDWEEGSHLMKERKCVTTHVCTWPFSFAFTLDSCTQRHCLKPRLRRVILLTTGFITLG